MATPVVEKSSNHKRQPPPPKSRYTRIKEAGSEPDMPHVAVCAHLTQWLWQFGPISLDGAAVSWQEIAAWSRMTDRTLSRWESETLRSMSEQYAIWANKAKDPQCPAPWKPIKLEGAVLTNKIVEIFKALSKGG